MDISDIRIFTSTMQAMEMDGPFFDERENTIPQK